VVWQISAGTLSNGPPFLPTQNAAGGTRAEWDEVRAEDRYARKAWGDGKWEEGRREVEGWFQEGGGRLQRGGEGRREGGNEGGGRSSLELEGGGGGRRECKVVACRENTLVVVD
jgi:hypothetical protein